MSVFNIFNKIRQTSDYDELKQVLFDANKSIIDPNSRIIVDQTNQSSLANFRKSIEKNYEAKVIEKDEYLGVVLFVPPPETDPLSGRLIYKVYVDVPGVDIEGIPHPDIFADETADLSFLEQKAFYPVSDSLFLSDYPSVNDIVRVKFSKNYFNGICGNPTDNVYLGISIKGTYLFPTTDKQISKPAAASLQLTKEVRRDSLFQKKPSNKPREEDLLSLPYKGDFLISGLPSLRIRPNYGTLQGHYALDIAMSVGTPIYSVNDQEVINVSEQKEGAGKFVKTTNGIYKYLYFHLSEQKVKKGDILKRGDLIGFSGNTGNTEGPHLHFEVREMNETKVNPLYLLKGELKVDEKVKNTFGLTSSILKVPFPLDENINSIDKVSVDLSEEQPTPSAVNQSRPNQSNATNKSNPVNRPKLLLKDFIVDKANGIKTTAYVGSKSIRVREDLIPDLTLIKEKLNQYNIALTCEDQDIKIINDKLSLLGKAGLEIRLNSKAALFSENNLDIDDYFVGPDYNHPIGNGYKLIVYGNVRRNIKYFDETYVPEKKVIEVYDPKSLSPNGPPKLKKIFKSVINITKIFEDQGFKSINPSQEFFLYSNLEKSNWNIFQKPAKITVGYSYKELLSTVYYNNGEPAWQLPDIKWDGNKFI